MGIKAGVYVVTGGASGLGAATARALVAAGGQVVLADVNPVAGQKAESALGGHARFVQTDVRDETSAAQAFAVARSMGEVAGLINCAGIAPAEKLLGKSGPHRLDSFVRALDINLVGTFNMARFAAQAMRENDPGESGERGVIVNTASVAAFDGQMGQAAYAASKGGVVAMTLPLARDLAKYGIRVVAIAPGIFETPMMLEMPDEVLESLGKTVPFPPRLGKPAEFSSLVMHVLENRYLNGEVIRVDGALRMAAR
ncbi:MULTISPECIES: SDR family NAD(P)-dependent oxidoreductase [unclassified Herbaspirillum]|uniref:SDR family NAD(P)-dependent oxidoreductase n=1 Tax=unclassified Herbaspirillum TaxID=2624150 RepID=UPI001152ACEA|nr:MULTISPECIES: SDR family NAD(P)-dependent oxidoreductase [unclassified Herbaspirillum]MBB5391509.1 NAD(P)-dependent dehydrogenase (short-subunit alcohol dehydrogenase family) [Herbaspirillum sp. SJZ102]TQK12807.1 NAD(P)-dependent dehydrogenase (short-subunit alcohol dehydrogenase family) [Herbaspirillum sp. SJZ130]TQK14811.1 NAD(P)-dependent dehydrogenase (short-subunit alcohol dehydrogenase family) [Herbaspirillum sp. SJZ106]TWC71062.1 NAD(P)-dependent dehydrogenase (short-subunit alcohol d